MKPKNRADQKIRTANSRLKGELYVSHLNVIYHEQLAGEIIEKMAKVENLDNKVIEKINVIE